MIQHTATPWAPWIVVPADDKPLARLIVAAAVVDAMDDMNLSYPKVTAAQKKDLDAAKQALLSEKGKKE
jgi:hypothetical protein